MIRIRRNNLNDLALEHYERVTKVNKKDDDSSLSKLLECLRDKSSINNKKHKMIQELIDLIKICNDDPETSIITCQPKLLEDHYIYFSKKYSALHKNKSFMKAIKTAFFYHNYKKWGAYVLADKLSVNTCPYCNRQSTFTIGNDIKSGTRPQFDHYINRASAPYLSLSFYNLIPSCSVCNSSMKHATFFSLSNYIHPYQDDMTEDIVFSISINKVGFINGEPDAYNLIFKRSALTIKPIAETDRAFNTYSAFRLIDLYNKHKDYVDELIQKTHAYPPDYLESLFNTYNGSLFKHKEDVYKMALSNYFLVDELEKRPLAKLTRDITIELGFLSETI